MKRERKTKLTAAQKLQELEERELQRFKTIATEHYLEAVEEFDRAIQEYDEGAPELRDAGVTFLKAENRFEHGARSGR